MTIKITLLLTLLAYSMIVSQSFMYILALKSVQLSMEVNSYIEFRKLVDTNMRSNFKYVVYAALLFNLLLVIITIKNPGSFLFIMAAIGLIALLIDMALTLKGNLPINDIINNWSPNNYPANWTDFQAKWLDIYQYRQIANISGFISLLIGAIFAMK